MEAAAQSFNFLKISMNRDCLKAGAWLHQVICMRSQPFQKLVFSLIPFLFLTAGCVTSTQGHVGYVVPGGSTTGLHQEFKQCGAPGAWTFLFDSHMIDGLLKKQEAFAEKHPEAAGYTMDVDVNIPSCYVLTAFQGEKK